MSNLDSVSGFQFRVTSTLDDFELGSASGGSSAEAEFQVSTSGTGIVLGFSFTGTSIESGFGLLTSIDISVSSTIGYIYLSEAVISDGFGIEMDFGVQDYFSVGGAPDMPEAPTNLTAEVIELTNVDLSWDTTDGASGISGAPQTQSSPVLQSPSQFQNHQKLQLLINKYNLLYLIH
jgi:hypothetical protein